MPTPPTPPTPVDRLYGEFTQLLAFLDANGEVSLRSVTDGSFRKALLLAAASYFERRLTTGIVDFVGKMTSTDHVVRWLVERKAVERQYHTWFDWNGRNANQFFRLFGRAFSDHAKAVVDNNEKLTSSVQACLEIGRDRNRLVHQDFASFPLEKTSEEICETYCWATECVEWFTGELRRFSDAAWPGEGMEDDCATPRCKRPSLSLSKRDPTQRYRRPPVVLYWESSVSG